MRPLSNTFMVRARLEDEGRIKIANGVDIIIDPGFNPYRYAVQVGEIAHCPKKIDADFIYDFELFPGDQIWFHHFCVSQDTAQVVDGEILYAIRYSQIYCVVRNGIIIPCQDYVFLTPVLEDESNCKTKSGLWIKSTQDPIPLIGKVEFTSKKADDIKVGDIVKFRKDSDYDLKINGTLYYIMREARIAAFMEL